MSPFFSHLALGSLGLSIAAVLAQLLLWSWRRRPLASYRLTCALLFGSLLLPAAQVAMSRFQPAKELPLVQHLAGVRASLDSEPPSAAGPGLEADPFSELSEEELATLLRVLAAEEQASAPDAAVLVAEETQDSPALLTGLAAVRSSVDRFPGGPLGLLAAVYGLGVALALLRLARRLVRTYQLVREAVPVQDPAVRAIWSELARRSAIGERLELLASHEVRAPVCIGLGRKVILLPVGPDDSPRAGWDPVVLRCVLLHELVHLERRDSWVMLAQEFFRACFWFHPAAWWLCHKLDALRELSCDLLVVQRTGQKKRYAQALLEYAAWMKRALPSPASTALLPWSGTKSQLSRRIEMLVSLPSKRSFPWTTMTAAVSLVSCLWGGQLAAAAALSPAQDPVPEAPPALAQEPLPPAPAAWPEPPTETAPEPWAQVRTAPAAPAAGAMRPARPTRTTRPEIARSPLPAPRPEPHPMPNPALAPAARPAFPSAPAVSAQDPESPFTRLGTANVQDTPMIGVYLADDAQDGVRINQVMEDSAAERTRLKAGDVIVAINGQRATREELNRAKSAWKKGPIVLTIRRGNELHEFVMPLPNQARAEASPRRLPAGVAGRVQPGQNEIQRAQEALERALALNPDDDGVRRALEALQTAQDKRAAEMKRRDEAALYLDRARRIQAEQKEYLERQDQADYLLAPRRSEEWNNHQRELDRRDADRKRAAELEYKRRQLETDRRMKDIDRSRAQEAEDYRRQQETYRALERANAQDQANRRYRQEATERQRSEAGSRLRRTEERDRRDVLEAELRSTEMELQRRLNELEALRARIRALDAERDRATQRRTRSSQGGMLPPGAGSGGQRGIGGGAGRLPGEASGGGQSGLRGQGTRPRVARSATPAPEPIEEPVGLRMAREVTELVELPEPTEPIEQEEPVLPDALDAPQPEAPEPGDR